MNNLPVEEDYRRMRIFLRVFFSVLIFILLMGMTKDLRDYIKNVPEKEKPKTILWQTEL